VVPLIASLCACRAMTGAETPSAADAAVTDGGAGEDAWLRVGAKAILKGIVKLPQLNGQIVEILSWNEEKKRWKCLLPKGGDVNVLPANLEQAEMPAEDVERVKACLEEGRLFEARQVLRGKACAPADLVAALDARLAPGTYSEIIDGRLVLRNFDGRGVGYLTTKDIKKGDVLLFDTAFADFHLEQADPNAGLNQTQEDPHQKLATKIKLERQKDDDFIKEKILDLCPSRFGDDKRPLLVRCLENNTFECTREPGRMALFVAASRFNHSCAPNVYADADRNECVIRALRDIKKGEEVCVSYVPVSDCLETRRKKLQAYGFECKCKRCQEEEKDDPQNKVVCKCGESEFTLKKESRMYQTCPVCLHMFDREEAEHHLSQIAEANKNAVSFLHSGGDAMTHIRKMSTLHPYTIKGAINGIPTVHNQTMFLLNNLANLHYYAANHIEGDHKESSLAAHHRFKKIALETFEEKHSNWTNQRDVDYFQILWVAVNHVNKGLPDELKKAYTEKLEDACKLHFGQASVPPNLTRRPQ